MIAWSDAENGRIRNAFVGYEKALSFPGAASDFSGKSPQKKLYWMIAKKYIMQDVTNTDAIVWLHAVISHKVMCMSRLR